MKNGIIHIMEMYESHCGYQHYIKYVQLGELKYFKSLVIKSVTFNRNDLYL